MMPQRSTVSLLPESIRNELNNRLINAGFSGYQELVDWLNSQGFEISKSSLHRYGQKFEARLAEIREATEQAMAMASACGDDENALGDALTRMAQQKAFQALMDMEDPGEMSLATLGRMIADLNRSSVTVKKFRVEVREKLNVKFKALEAEGRNGNLDPETLRRVREEVYGLF